jgi:hypothetical protein
MNCLARGGGNGLATGRYGADQTQFPSAGGVGTVAISFAEYLPLFEGDAAGAGRCAPIAFGNGRERLMSRLCSAVSPRFDYRCVAMELPISGETTNAREWAYDVFMPGRLRTRNQTVADRNIGRRFGSLASMAAPTGNVWLTTVLDTFALQAITIKSSREACESVDPSVTQGSNVLAPGIPFSGMRNPGLDAGMERCQDRNCPWGKVIVTYYGDGVLRAGKRRTDQVAVVASNGDELVSGLPAPGAMPFAERSLRRQMR